ncbi:carbohydrate kinase family protein [Microlunatus soli]|uniref:Fructokinase n=1 Tax=Microlunatus soli TaxID=630515 RepID=A0A1H1YHV7_9ACTN|nr:carbohydrate kinase [Microlunatus soli]SDT21118.1 fructokinase [Microlunatus soli]
MTADPGRRFVVCGETLIDLVRDEDAPGDTFSSGWQALSAGGPMNTSVALAMLGADSHFLGRVSTDEFGRQLTGHMDKAGVGLDLAVTSEQFTSLAVVSLDEQGKASYAFHFDQTANFDWRAEELPTLNAQDWLHLGSLALVVRPGADVLLEWVRRVEAPISIDINVRSSVISDPDEYWRRIEPWLQALGGNGIVKASDEDVEFLARALAVPTVPPERLSSPGGRIDAGGAAETVSGAWRQVAERWLQTYGLKMVVITRGEGGAAALAPAADWVEVPGFPTEVVDTVGAGDTFMAGFLDGHLRLGAELPDALRRGAAAASIVCSRQGAQPPTAAEVDAFLR